MAGRGDFPPPRRPRRAKRRVRNPKARRPRARGIRQRRRAKPKAGNPRAPPLRVSTPATCRGRRIQRPTCRRNARRPTTFIHGPSKLRPLNRPCGPALPRRHYRMRRPRSGRRRTSRPKRRETQRRRPSKLPLRNRPESRTLRRRLRIRLPRSGRRPTSRWKRRRKRLKRQKPHPPRTKPSRCGGSRELPIRANQSPIIARRDGGFRRPILSALPCNPARAARRPAPRSTPRAPPRRPGARRRSGNPLARVARRPGVRPRRPRSLTRDATAGRRREGVRAGREGRWSIPCRLSQS